MFLSSTKILNLALFPYRKHPFRGSFININVQKNQHTDLVVRMDLLGIFSGFFRIDFGTEKQAFYKIQKRAVRNEETGLRSIAGTGQQQTYPAI